MSGAAVEQALREAASNARRGILMSLHKSGALTLARLCDALNMPPHAVVAEVSALERLGLVRREDSLVYLTETGRRAVYILLNAGRPGSRKLLLPLKIESLAAWLSVSPHSSAISLMLLLGWIASLIIGALYKPPLVLLGVIYAGCYLTPPVDPGPHLSLAASLASALGILLVIHLLSRRRIAPPRAVLGVYPLALYPAAHLVAVELARALNAPYLVTASQIASSVVPLLTAFTHASFHALETGSSYERTLLYSLFAFFVAPALFYSLPVR
jgi:DNA-binding MarR family transcriptional regulator